MHRPSNCLLSVCACIFVLWVGVTHAEFSRKLKKPQAYFFYPQVNLHVGYDSANARKALDWASRGSATQVAAELFYKNQTRLQRGYTKLIALESANLKGALEWSVRSDQAFSEQPRFRLLDSWLKFDTKWDRTKVWIGHRTIPYGHNPRLDPDLSFLPNQSNFDLGFGRDKGLFLRIPMGRLLDLELSATLGMGDTFDYHGGWLVVGHLGSPTFRSNEFGLFALGGKVQQTRGPRNRSNQLKDVFRVGGEWIHKSTETLKWVNQVSGGLTQLPLELTNYQLNVINAFEWFLASRWSLGLTHLLRLLNERGGSARETNGRVLASFSYAPTRNIRIRLNPFVEYTKVGTQREYGGFVQACWGCGLRK